MQTMTHSLAGEACTIFVPERDADLDGFDRFLALGDKVLGFDTETTNLDVYTPGHGCRLVQLGNRTESWVLRTDLFRERIAAALRQPRAFTAHNAPFDLLVADRHLGVSIEELGPRVFDTYVLGHLLDPRAANEGGSGLGLKALSSIYVDSSAPDTSGDLTAVFRSLGLTKATGWAGIPIDHPTYLLYAGLDPILAVRLFGELAPTVRDLGLDNLSRFEHHFQVLLAIMQRKGIRVDVPYVERLKADLLDDVVNFRGVAARYGVENVNSTAQVAEALGAMGESLTARTPSGGIKVNKDVLLPLADLDADWQRIEARTPNPLADAVLRSKRAGKWAESYAQAFLDLRDANDRLHPFIGSLQARTARMSISRPPLQQLPSSDWRIRRALVADPGYLICASDYSQVEMRVLAALADVKQIKEAVRQGRSIHEYTAELLFGPDYPKWKYKVAKNTGFAKVYGGGVATISRTSGAGEAEVREVIDAYDAAFPEIKTYGRALQRRAEFGRKEVVTPSGRHLPLDRDRLYAATNYVVQSTARDLLAQAIVDVFEAGMGDYLLLPVHDELVAQAPEAEAKDVILEIGRIMESTFLGVEITADPEVYGPTWGHGYGAPD